MSDSVRVPTTVIDADGHVVEPLEAWAHLPEEHRPLIHSDQFRLRACRGGRPGDPGRPLGHPGDAGRHLCRPVALHLLGRGPAGWFGPGGPSGRHGSRGHRSGGPLSLDRPLLLGARPTRPTATMVASAYNDWLSGYCAADPGPPVRRGHASACRTRRRRRGSCGGPSTSSGFKAAFVRPNPCMGRSLSDPAYEPVWNAAEELGVPDRRPRGEFGDRAHAGLGPALQSPDPARRFALLRGDVGLRPAHGVRDARASSRPPHRVPRVRWRLGALLARTPRRAVRELRRILPGDAHAAERVLCPPMRHQLRGRRGHASGPAAVHRP